MYESETEKVINNLTGAHRSTVVDGIPLSYHVYKLPDDNAHGNIDWCWADSDGNIYVSELLTAPSEMREKFRDLIAYHERLEYDWLIEQGLPAPKYNNTPCSREGNFAEDIHIQVHYLELRAARSMGILDAYVAWRPEESITPPNGRQMDITPVFHRQLRNNH